MRPKKPKTLRTHPKEKIGGADTPCMKLLEKNSKVVAMDTKIETPVEIWEQDPQTWWYFDRKGGRVKCRTYIGFNRQIGFQMEVVSPWELVPDDLKKQFG